MTKRLTSLLLEFIISITIVYSQKSNLKQEVDFVNSYIGTAEKGAGGLALSVGPPFTMTNFSPQTCENKIGRMYYVYEDTTILGFIASHQPTVWMGDYGYVSVMPEINSLKTLPENRKLFYKHSDEIVSPNYYSVKMKTENNSYIKTEIAATERCGILKFTFPESKESHLVFQALNIDDSPEPSWATQLNSKENRIKNVTAFIKVDIVNKEISGYNPDRQSLNLGPVLNNFKGYFVIQFNNNIDSFGTWNNDSILHSVNELYGKKRLGAYISFSTKKNEIVKVKIATSFISLGQARENLKNEIPDWDFNKVSLKTRNDWQTQLEKIKIADVTEEKKTVFYTAFYHCLLFPRKFSEYGKYYSAFDDKIHDGISYTDFSLWDTYRALHPFLLFVQPEKVNDMINAMLQMYQEGGRLPMWPNPAETNIMIGTHADDVIADAYVKGLRGFDVNSAYEAMRKDAFMPTACDNPTNKFRDRQIWSCYEGQAGQAFFHSLGYIPSDYKAESVSRTIEYGINDYSIAQISKIIGKKNDYDSLIQWSKNYKNLYNKETGFLAPRLYNGNWDSNIDEGFSEGSPWTYLFGSVQDIPGLIELLGGKIKFSEKLDENFNKGHYKHDNEPGHHYTYLYDYCGQPWKTQELIRKNTEINYKNQPDGINGNDDCGQMSAWYIFSVMGFYPVTPGSGIYAIGAPQFPKLTMEYTVNRKRCKLEIIANNISNENKYIQDVTLDGKHINKPFISHQEIIQGSKLIFEMGAKPNYNWK